MLKLITGGLGTGKTKKLIDLANEISETAAGNQVFIDDDSRHMYDLRRQVRFINVKDFPIENVDEFLGFLCGIISNDYDTDHMFIDGLFKVMTCELRDISAVIPRIERLSEMFDVAFYITVSTTELPEEFKKYEYKG